MASAEEVCCTAVQVNGKDMEFLLMVEALVAIVTALLSTVALGALSTLGAGTMTTFSLGFHHSEFQVKQGELLWLY